MTLKIFLVSLILFVICFVPVTGVMWTGWLPTCQSGQRCRRLSKSTTPPDWCGAGPWVQWASCQKNKVVNPNSTSVLSRYSSSLLLNDFTHLWKHYIHSLTVLFGCFTTVVCVFFPFVVVAWLDKLPKENEWMDALMISGNHIHQHTLDLFSC